MKLNIAGAGAETGALLRQYLGDRGVGEEPSSIVCYGSTATHRHILNQACSLDKIQRMKLMGAGGVRTIPWFLGSDPIPRHTHFPLLARVTHGHGGTDIVPVFQREEVEWRVRSGWDWFSEYVPLQTEFRVWVFRNRVLGTYEKVMMRPTTYKWVGRNFRNGFDFQFRQLPPVVVTDLALNAVRAVGFDFGAVDILLGQDGLPYILEVNTAPGAIKSGAQATLGLLADCLVEWEQDRYPTW